MKAAIEELVDQKEFNVEVVPSGGHVFTISANDSGRLVALLLKRQREAKELTVREVAKRRGSNSPNAYAQYEQGERKPKVDKLDELLAAVNAGSPVIQVQGNAGFLFMGGSPASGEIRNSPAKAKVARTRKRRA